MGVPQIISLSIFAPPEREKLDLPVKYVIHIKYNHPCQCGQGLSHPELSFSY